MAAAFGRHAWVNMRQAPAGMARLSGVTQARPTQIMNLLNLAPDIQEEILFLPRVGGQRDAIALV